MYSYTRFRVQNYTTSHTADTNSHPPITQVLVTPVPDPGVCAHSGLQSLTAEHKMTGVEEEFWGEEKEQKVFSKNLDWELKPER